MHWSVSCFFFFAFVLPVIQYGMIQGKYKRKVNVWDKDDTQGK